MTGLYILVAFLIDSSAANRVILGTEKGSLLVFDLSNASTSLGELAHVSRRYKTYCSFVQRPRRPHL